MRGYRWGGQRADCRSRFSKELVHWSPAERVEAVAVDARAQSRRKNMVAPSVAPVNIVVATPSWEGNRKQKQCQTERSMNNDAALSPSSLPSSLPKPRRRRLLSVSVALPLEQKIDASIVEWMVGSKKRSQRSRPMRHRVARANSGGTPLAAIGGDAVRAAAAHPSTKTNACKRIAAATRGRRRRPRPLHRKGHT